MCIRDRGIVARACGDPMGGLRSTHGRSVTASPSRPHTSSTIAVHHWIGPLKEVQTMGPFYWRRGIGVLLGVLVLALVAVVAFQAGAHHAVRDAGAAGAGPY